MSSLLRLSLEMSLLSSLQPWGCALHPRSQQVGVRAEPVPREESGAGSWTRCIWPIREWLHPYSTDTGHISVSELSPCKGNVDVENSINVKSDSPETLVRECDDIEGGDMNWPSAEMVYRG